MQKTPVWFVSALVAYSDFLMALKNGFGKCSLFDLSANGWKEPNIDWPILLQYDVKAISRKFA